MRVIVKNKVSFQHWGHFITTPYISKNLSKVNISSKIKGENVSIATIIRDMEGNIVAENITNEKIGNEIEQNIDIKNPKLWSTKTPYLYSA